MILQGDARPVRATGLRLGEVTETNVLLDENGQEVLALNETALALWDLCDGATSVDEMVAAVVQLFGADPRDIRRDVAEAIGQLHDCGAVSYYVP